MDWSLLLALTSIDSSCNLLLAQVSPSPKPSAALQTVDAATIEFLKSQFSSLTTSFNIYVGLLSAVTVIFVGVAAWLFKRTLAEAKQEVDQLVRAEVKREIARSIKSRVDFLEQVLQREEVPSLVAVDYVLQTATGTLPKEYRLLHARFPRIKVRKLDSRKFTGDVVVLDMVNYLPTGSKLEEPELEQVLQEVTDRMAPESVLAVYVRGRYGAIETLGQKIAYYTSTNVPTQLLGNVINSAYVAYT
ncbi:MAG: hypothetical protein WCA35_08960, partial [Kovacikia sp.]